MEQNQIPELPEIDGTIKVTKDIGTNYITYNYEHEGGDIIGISLELLTDSNTDQLYLTSEGLIQAGTLKMRIIGIKLPTTLVCKLIV